MKDVKLLGTATNTYYGDRNDISINTDKDFNVLQYKDKVRQCTVKILLTHLGSHKIFTGYGSNLINLVKNKLDEFLPPAVRDAIIYSLTYLKNIEQSTLTIERLDTILDIIIQKSETDARVLNVFITLKLENGEILDVSLNKVMNM
jgi:phage baseplate assembly protein W